MQTSFYILAKKKHNFLDEDEWGRKDVPKSQEKKKQKERDSKRKQKRGWGSE